MFTSKSDRRSWLGAIALFAFIAGLVYLFGIWPLVSQTLLAYADTASQHIGQAYFFTFLVNLGFILPLYLIEKIRYNI